MPEKEPKFINQETEKVSQEVEDKIEEKEMKKSPEEMLKEVLPLAWEDACGYFVEKKTGKEYDQVVFEYNKQHGRTVGTPVSFKEIAESIGLTEVFLRKEIKHRIDLAKKYNLEIEHFFYDPEKLEREVPTQEQIEKTAKELEYIREFAEEFSRQSKKPVFCIFNARNGTVYSYGMYSINSQLNVQFESLARKERKGTRELRDEFTGDLKNDGYWIAKNEETNPLIKKLYKKLAVLCVARDWMDQDRIDYLAVNWKDFKVSSALFDTGGTAKEVDAGARTIIEECVNCIKGSDFNLVFIDATARQDFPVAFEGLTDYLILENPQFKISNRNRQLKRTIENIVEEDLDKIGLKTASYGLINAFSDASEDPEKRAGEPWFDNFPQVLGRIGKKFAHRRWREEAVCPTELIVQSAQQVEYLSEKVKNALRYYQKDEQGRNWFERNFEGIMLGKKDAPQKGTPEYLEKFRKWVPYETDEKGEAILDDKGYPIPRKTAPMAVAAEDELSRIGAAMEELER